MAYKVFSNGDALTGGELNTYLMNQAVISFATTTARDAALPSPSEGQLVWLEDSNKYVYYSGSAWTDLITPAGGDNAIINGAFDIWQRGTSFSGSNDLNVWTADRFRAYIGSGGSMTASQQTFTPGTAPVSGYEGAYFLRVAKTAVNTGFTLDHFIEDVRTFAGKTVTLSFWAKADASFSMTPKFWQAFGSGGSSSVITNASSVSLTTSWARYSVSLTVPSISGKTIGTGSFLAIRLWDFTDALAHTFDIWGLQLEAGSTATAFKRNASNIQGELAACQRYYFRESLAGFAGSAIQGFALSSTSYTMWTRFPVTMRTAPTSLDYSNLRVLDSGNSAQSVTNLTILSTDAVKTSSSDVTVTVSGATSGRTGYLQANAGAAYVGFSAEL